MELFIVIASVWAALVAEQPLLAVTLRFPFVEPQANSAMTDVVPCPDTIVIPVPEYDQVYVTAPVTGAIE